LQSLINRVIEQIFPESTSVHLIVESHSGNGSGHGMMDIQSLVDMRIKGDSSATVVLGFDSFEKVKLRDGASIFDAPGVFFVKLPDSLSSIKAVLAEAVESRISDEDRVDESNLRRHAIRRVRSFKHTSDNAWMAMKANANRAKRLSKKESTQVPSVIREISRSRVERLVEECYQIEPLARYLGLKQADQLRPTIDEVMTMWNTIYQDNLPSERAIVLAFACAANIQSISEILSEVKELPDND